jgi:hypothetical protein
VFFPKQAPCLPSLKTSCSRFRTHGIMTRWMLSAKRWRTDDQVTDGIISRLKTIAGYSAGLVGRARLRSLGPSHLSGQRATLLNMLRLD